MAGFTALVVGDVFGGAGMRAAEDALPKLREQHQPDIVVVNAENAAHGSGTTPKQAEALIRAGSAATGRRFAKSPRCLRRRRSAFSGRSEASRMSHFGPPTAPRRTASAARQWSRSASRIGSPWVSIAIPPMWISDHASV